jgi:hypothetical protein
MKKRVTVIAALGALATGCGNDPGSFNGTVGGIGMSVKDAIFAPIKGSDGSTIGAFVEMSDVPDLCSVLKANRDLKYSTLVAFALMRTKSDGSAFLAPAKGQYLVTPTDSAKPGDIALAVFGKNDANCNNELAADQSTGRSGTVTLDTLDMNPGGTGSGIFDVTFGSQAETVTGSINATLCDVDLSKYSNPTCE